MKDMQGSLACLECGEPIHDATRWLCSDRCAAVMSLVRYGRSDSTQDPKSADPDGLYVDQDILNRYRRKAGIIGHFPSVAVRQAVRGRDRGRCQHPGCTERGVTRTDWRSDDPVLTRPVRAGDLRTLCAHHHRDVSVRRFVGQRRYIARTGPAIWARIVSAEPLVLRDDPALWAEPSDRRLLTNWPVTPQARRDLRDWLEALKQVPSTSAAVAPGGGEGLDDLEVRLNAALESLHLPIRRRERLVRTARALLLMWQADEGTREAMEQEP